ncbi:MAG: hypothetical protein FJ306_01335 [Planctomycetes bacterium]|nr:hypothetical protein [Planctomycetota bacterium]
MHTRRRLVFAFAALLAAPAAAQCFESNFGTPLASPGQLVGDIELPIQPIGFAFPLGSTTYTDLHITDKGYVWLSNAGVPATGGVDFSATAQELATDAPRIAPLWSDLLALATNNAQIHLNSSPTRCIVTWENLTCYSGTCGLFTVQLQLLPSGEMLFFYGPGATNNSVVSTWQAGVCGVSPGNSAFSGGVDLSSGGFTANTVLAEEWLTPATFDMAARGLRVTPVGSGWAYSLPAGCAGATTFGTGCVSATDSVYEEWFANCDLANTTLTWRRSGAGYLLLNGLPGTFVVPSASATNLAPNQLDGAELVTLSGPMPVPGGTTTTLSVTTKGQIEVASVVTPVIDYTPSPQELFDAPNTTFAFWHDYNQTAPGSGLILFEEVAGVAYITWNGVHSFSSPLPTTFQFQFTIATGDVRLVVQSLGGVANPDNAVAGFSVGGVSSDPGPSDLTNLPSGAIALADVGSDGLALDPVGVPSIGNAAFALATNDASNLIPLGFVFFGTSAVLPGLDLTFLGMPGCFGYQSSDLGAFSFPVAGGGGTLPLPIPNNAQLVGSLLHAQSVCFSLATPLNLVSSNGVTLSLGF